MNEVDQLNQLRSIINREIDSFNLKYKGSSSYELKTGDLYHWLLITDTETKENIALNFSHNQSEVERLEQLHGTILEVNKCIEENSQYPIVDLIIRCAPSRK